MLLCGGEQGNGSDGAPLRGDRVSPSRPDLKRAQTPKSSARTHVRRRSLLAAGVAGAAAAAWPTAARAQSQTTGRLAKLEPPLAPNDPLLALVNRTTQGFNRLIWEEAQALGYHGFLDKQLHPESIGDAELDAKLAPFGTLNLTSAEIYTAYAGPVLSKIPVKELEQVAALRSIHSNRQLFERTVEFWTDHFSMNHYDGPLRIFKTTDDRDVIRAHGFGTFGDLLRGSAHSPAMLHYLDNHTNVKGAAQENYARELMELHSLGIGGGASIVRC